MSTRIDVDLSSPQMGCDIASLWLKRLPRFPVKLSFLSLLLVSISFIYTVIVIVVVNNVIGGNWYFDSSSITPMRLLQKQNLCQEFPMSGSVPTLPQSATFDKTNKPSNLNDNERNSHKTWMRISDEVFVYSGHLDTRNFPIEPENSVNSVDNLLIRVVGIKAIPSLREFAKHDILDWFRMKGEMDFSQKYSCKLFFTRFNSSLTLESLHSSRVTYIVIEEGVKIYASTYFNCYFSVNASSIDMDSLQVSLYPRNVSDYPAKLIEVSTTKDEKSEKSLSICVRPLFGPFDDIDKLTEFISYYHVFGITHFNFYSISISPRVRKYLEGLQQRWKERNTFPRFILRDWNLPTGNTSELWDYGALAALNDCLLSNMNKDYIVFVDIDEFIVPRNGISSLWTIISSYNTSTTFQYTIRNTFYCHEFCTNNSLNISSGSMSTQAGPDIPHLLTISGHGEAPFAKSLSVFRCVIRTKRIWNAALRSKFIVNPRQVLAVGHHLVTKFVKKADPRFSSNTVQVNPDIAVLHHYRECSSISSYQHPVLTRIRIIDNSILEFKQKVEDIYNRYYSTFI